MSYSSLFLFFHASYSKILHIWQTFQTEQEAGPIGYFMIIVGIVGSIYYARLVDNTGAFR